ncbi:MAG: HEAT repeat domain-containing protein [Bacteroidales bacterium]|nr:HEAT repeat domain-containing protein [Bacteroidales bacterium]
MNILDEEKMELENFDFPQEVLTNLYALIDIDNFRQHRKAKKRFIDQGVKILPVMHTLMTSEFKTIRKEAIKIVEHIADKSSIPTAIETLKDSESEIRWIAAEALIRIGRSCIRPLLEALIAKNASINITHGAHHVLSKLTIDNDPEELKELLHITRHGHENPDRIPVFAAKALESDVW